MIKMIKLAWLTIKNSLFVRVFWMLAGIAVGLGMVIGQINMDSKWSYKWFKLMKF